MRLNIDKLNSFVVHLENTYSEEGDEYNELIDRILEIYETIIISWMEDFTIIDSDFYEFVIFDEENYATDLL